MHLRCRVPLAGLYNPGFALVPDLPATNTVVVAAVVAAAAAHRQSRAEQDLPRFRLALLIFLS